MNRLASRLALCLSLLAVLSFVACGPPTLEGSVARYKAALTKLDVLSAKSPQFRDSIEKKKFEAARDFETAQALPGEDGARAVARVASDLETFERGLNPQPQTTNRPAGSKLDNPQPGSVPVQPVANQPAQPGGKLGGTAPAANTGAGFGTPTPAPAPAPAPAPGDSGFGTPPTANTGAGFGTPTPTPAPAPAPTPAPAPAPDNGSGFGGK